MQQFESFKSKATMSEIGCKKIIHKIKSIFLNENEKLKLLNYEFEINEGPSFNYRDIASDEKEYDIDNPDGAADTFCTSEKPH